MEYGTIKIWNTVNGNNVRTLFGHTDYVYGLVILPDGTLASSSVDRTIKIWNTIAGNEIRALHGHTDAVRGLAVLSDGALASCQSHYIIIWN